MIYLSMYMNIVSIHLYRCVYGFIDVYKLCFCTDVGSGYVCMYWQWILQSLKTTTNGNVHISHVIVWLSHARGQSPVRLARISSLACLHNQLTIDIHTLQTVASVHHYTSTHNYLRSILCNFLFYTTLKFSRKKSSNSKKWHDT